MTDTLQAGSETAKTDPLLTPRPDLRPSTTQQIDGETPLTVRMERTIERCGRWTRARSDQARDSIRAHPLWAGLGAVGAGLVLGMLLRR